MSVGGITVCGYLWEDISTSHVEHECNVVMLVDRPHHTHICKCFAKRDNESASPGTVSNPVINPDTA